MSAHNFDYQQSLQLDTAVATVYRVTTSMQYTIIDRTRKSTTSCAEERFIRWLPSVSIVLPY